MRFGGCIRYVTVRGDDGQERRRTRYVKERQNRGMMKAKRKPPLPEILRPQVGFNTQFEDEAPPISREKFEKRLQEGLAREGVRRLPDARVVDELFRRVVRFKRSDYAHRRMLKLMNSADWKRFKRLAKTLVERKFSELQKMLKNHIRLGGETKVLAEWVIGKLKFMSDHVESSLRWQKFYEWSERAPQESWALLAMDDTLKRLRATPRRKLLCAVAYAANLVPGVDNPNKSLEPLIAMRLHRARKEVVRFNEREGGGLVLL